jgi:hypothetical protein
VVENRTENYPVRVIVTAQVDGKDTPIWSGRQQDLFSKYSSKRKASMDAITTKAKALYEQTESS